MYVRIRPVYQDFKNRTRTKIDEVFRNKLVLRSDTINNVEAQLREIGFVGIWNHIEGDEDDEVISIDSDDDLDDKPDEDLDTSATNRSYTLHLGTPAVHALLKILKEVMRPSSLSNDDLYIIVNGRHDDPPSLSPFVSTFTRHNINNCFFRVGIFHLLGNASTASISASN